MPFAVSRAVFASAFLFAALPAFAEPVPKLSSRDEYRICVDEQEKLTPRLKELNARRDERNAEMKKFQDESKAHAATQSSLDQYDEAAVDAFNAKVDELNHRSDELNARGNAIDKDMSVYNAAAIALNQRCAGMVVTTRVHDAVLKLRAVNPKK